MRIKNLFLALFTLTFLFVSCSDKNPVEPELTIVGTWELYGNKEVMTEESENPKVIKDEIYTEFLTTVIFKADGTAIITEYDEDTKEWVEIPQTYEAKDGNFKMVEVGVDENEPGYHTKGTFELTKTELVLKQTIKDGTTIFDYTNRLRRK